MAIRAEAAEASKAANTAEAAGLVTSTTTTYRYGLRDFEIPSWRGHRVNTARGVIYPCFYFPCSLFLKFDAVRSNNAVAKTMLEFRTQGFNGYAVKYSPFFDSRVAVVSAANFGLVGNGRLYILSLGSSGIIAEKWYLFLSMHSPPPLHPPAGRLPLVDPSISAK